MRPIEKKPKRPPVWKKIAGGLFYLIVCVIAMGLGTGAQWVQSSPVIGAALIQKILNEKPEDVFTTDAVTLLILGCDEDRSYGGGKITKSYARSDTMLVARIDFKNNRVGAVSIPRDLEVAAGGYSGRKINAYHVLGGPDLAQLAAETVVGVRIDKCITINYEAFQKMVDAAGGVEVYVEKRLKYDDNAARLHIDLQAGRQKLNGYQAMGFVRFRHDAMSDFKRQDRQKEFLLGLKDSVKNNPGTFRDVTNCAEAVLNGKLSSQEVAALGLFMQGVASDNIKMGMVPVYEGSGSNLQLDTAKLAEVLAANYITESAGGTQFSRR